MLPNGAPLGACSQAKEKRPRIWLAMVYKSFLLRGVVVGRISEIGYYLKLKYPPDPKLSLKL